MKTRHIAAWIIVPISLLVVLVVSMLVFVPQDSPVPAEHEQKRWEVHFKAGIHPEYSHFKGEWLDPDMSAYIFSYRVAGHVRSREFWEYFIEEFRHMGYELKSTDTDDEVRFFMNHPRSNVEWTIAFCDTTRYVTVLYWDIDSTEERTRLYPVIHRHHRSIHQKGCQGSIGR